MRLTTDNAVENMDMMELAHNSCYAKDRKARYRDYDMDMDARDFARNLMSTLTNDELPLDDVSFDEEVLENLQYDCFSDIRGLIALFYRNLWAMADLRETLKGYEDAEEQGLLLRLPCKVGNTVFLVQCGKVYERKVSGFSITSNNRFVVHVPDCEMDNATLPVEWFGKRAIFSAREEAEAALAEKGGAE